MYTNNKKGETMNKKPETHFHHKDDIESEYKDKLTGMLLKLPAYCKGFFLDIQDNYLQSSRYQTACDLNNFFLFLTQTSCSNYKVKEIPLDVLGRLSLDDMNEYKAWLDEYTTEDGTVHSNKANGKRRKISSLKAFYKYLFKCGYIKSDPSANITLPKIYPKEVIALTDEEIVHFLKTIRTGSGLSKRAMIFHRRDMLRDYSIVTMLIGTGMRISELISINMQDIYSYSEVMVRVIRKGGKEDHIYLADEVIDALDEYLEHYRGPLFRDNDESTDALYVSANKTRLTVRAVENLVKKYADLAFGKGCHNICCHKMRSTRGSQIYDETGDIEAVKEVLGHSSIATSSAYYVKGSEKRKKIAKMPLY